MSGASSTARSANRSAARESVLARPAATSAIVSGSVHRSQAFSTAARSGCSVNTARTIALRAPSQSRALALALMAQTTPATAPAATTTLATLLNTPPSYAGDRHALLRLPAMSSGARADNALAAGLDHPLPAEVVAGTGTAVLVAGWCFAPGSRVKSLKLTVNGAEQRVLAHGMSRRDVAAANPEHPESHASGFWGFVLIDAPGTASIGVKATLTGGRTERADLAEIHVIEAPDPVELAPPASGPLIAVAMATYNPDPELLAIQLDSLRAQSHANWVCVISDDCSDDKYYAQLKSAIANDPRFHLSRSSKRLGFYNNFERALTMVPSAADFVALADQDDRWHPDKLEVLLREIGDAALVFSDARLTTASGEVLASTYWSVRRRTTTVPLRCWPPTQ